MRLFNILGKKKVETLENKSVTSINNVFWNYRTELAYNLYYDWFYTQRLNIPKSVVTTIVNSAAQEFDFSISPNDNALQKTVDFIKGNLKIIEAHLCIGGMVALKPYIKHEKLGVAIYGARDFCAFYNEFGELESVYFKSDIRKSETESYTFVEIHTYNYNTREYRIDNQLYKGVNNDWNRKVGRQAPQLGSRVPLSACVDTAYLDDFYVIEDIDRHLCSVISLDNSMTYNKGRPIYDSSIELIQDAEKQYDSLLWEYKGGELAIDANADLFRPAGKSKQGNYIMPEGKDRLYRRLEGAGQEFQIETFAPALRDQNYINGLNEILRKIEANCGLYYGALSNTEYHRIRTASEVIASKQRFYTTVMDIKNKIKIGIADILENCITLYNQMMPDFLRENITVDFFIGDSIIDLISPNISKSDDNTED